MAKLRVIKDRKNSGGSEDQDLRGLGQTDIMANEYPWVFLTCRTNGENIVKAKEIFSLRSKIGKDAGLVHLFKPGTNLTHKEKSLELFSAGLLMLSNDPSASICLGQKSIMDERIKGHSLKDIFEETSSDYTDWKKTQGILEVSSTIGLYLSQAGFHLQSLRVEHGQIHQLMNVSSSQSTNAKRKIS